MEPYPPGYFTSAMVNINYFVQTLNKPCLLLSCRFLRIFAHGKTFLPTTGLFVCFVTLIITQTSSLIVVEIMIPFMGDLFALINFNEV